MTGEDIFDKSEVVTMEWSLWRIDSHGNQYRMPLNFNDQSEAISAEEAYTAKGHHQTYHAKQMPVGDIVDFIPSKD